MKLFEILDVKQINHPKNTEISPSTPTGRKEMEHEHKVINTYGKNKRGILGTGIEAIVFSSNRPQNAGVATKWLRNQPTDYSTNKVIQYLIKSQETNSTFAPKVYSITQYKRPNGLYEFSIQMEKLPMTLYQYQVKSQHDKMLMQQILQQVYNDGEYPIYMQANEAIRQGFKDVYPESTPQAIKYVKFLKTCSNYLDIHNQNIMVRLTSVGPQLVITDPVIGMDNK